MNNLGILETKGNIRLEKIIDGIGFTSYCVGRQYNRIQFCKYEDAKKFFDSYNLNLSLNENYELFK